MKEKIIFKNINGIKCYVIQKKDFKGKMAMVSFKYGSKDNEFQEDNQNFKMPFGIAHFLEHKLFEDKDINVFDEFSKLGASVNAFTNFNNTAYYFNTIDNFNQCLALLMNMVSKPYFTVENVQKEKGIIAQEIKMYDDDPNWAGYFEMLKAMYKNNDVRENIAGNIESINKITKDTLYKCYNSFYTNKNTSVVCCGNIEPKDVFSIIQKNLQLFGKKNVEMVYSDENDILFENFVHQKMGIEQNIFNIGFKELKINGTIIDRITETKVLLDIIAGRRSNFYKSLFDKSIIDESFYFDYCLDFNFGFCVFSGGSKNPTSVLDKLNERISYLIYNGISKEECLIAKNKQIGELIKTFNSINDIVSIQAELSGKDCDLKQLLYGFKNIDENKLNKRLKELFYGNKAILSVVE